MKLGKRKLIMFTIIITIAVTAIAGFVLVQYKDRTYFNSPPYEAELAKPSDVLVVYFSRSGYTEAMAREIARKFNADTVNIKSDKYSLDFTGWRNAANDADAQVTSVEITPETIDMSKYRLIFIGSPIWWYRPAPPLWTFVEKNNFLGKNVILFNTFNSRFKNEEIAKFQEALTKNNGKLLDHVFVRRGRVYYQITGQELIEQSKITVEEKMEEWLKVQ